MKICILSNEGYPMDLNPSCGGVQFATYYLARELRKCNHEVHVITRSRQSRCEIDQDGVYVHYISFSSRNHFLSPKYYYNSIIDIISLPVYNILVLNIILKISPDIVHCQHTSQISAVLMAKLLHHIPYGVVIHSEFKGGRLVPFPWILRKYWGKLPYVTQSSFFVGLSSSAKDDLDKKLGIESLVIPNGVDQSCYYPSTEKRWSKKDDNLTIITVSRLIPGKGLEDAITSMAYIIKHVPSAKMYIVGGGGLFDALQVMASRLCVSNNIIFTGPLPPADVAGYYRKAMIYLLPSLSEGFSLVLLEACSCGLPIVATPVGIAPELLTKANNGYLVPMNNPEEIARAVLMISNNQDEYEKMRQQSLIVASEYNWSKIAKRYEQLYSGIINDK